MSYVVGHRFKAWDGHFYICDSYDPRIGYWMTREDAPPENRADTEGTWRRNVSERVIGRTYHYAPLSSPDRTTNTEQEPPNATR